MSAELELPFRRARRSFRPATPWFPLYPCLFSTVSFFCSLLSPFTLVCSLSDPCKRSVYTHCLNDRAPSFARRTTARARARNQPRLAQLRRRCQAAALVAEQHKALTRAPDFLVVCSRAVVFCGRLPVEEPAQTVREEKGARAQGDLGRSRLSLFSLLLLTRSPRTAK